MIKKLTSISCIVASATFPLAAQDAKPVFPSPPEIVAKAKAEEWTAIAPSDLLVMDLASDAKGKARRVVIQLIPPPFSKGWVGNIRKLAAAQIPFIQVLQYLARLKPYSGFSALNTKKSKRSRNPANDPYGSTLFGMGWPLASAPSQLWPVHCYGMVGVARDVAPDSGQGSALYAVIGQAPRRLDHNLAVAGRVLVLTPFGWAAALVNAAFPLAAAIALAICSGATTMAVRVPGRPSFERLIVRITCGAQCGCASVKMTFGNGAP